MASLTDKKLGELVQLPSFQGLDSQGQRRVKLKWVAEKNKSLRKQFGDQYDPQVFLNQLSENKLIDDIRVLTPQEEANVAASLPRTSLESTVIGKQQLDPVSELNPAFLIDAVGEQAQSQLANLISRPVGQVAKFAGAIADQQGKTGISDKLSQVSTITDELNEVSTLNERSRRVANQSLANPEKFLFIAEQSLPFLLASVTGTAVGGPAGGAAVSFPLLAAAEFEGLDKFDEDKRIARSFGSAAAQLPLELFSATKLLKLADSSKLFKGLAKATDQGVLGEAKLLLSAFLNEGVTESLQEIVSIMAESDDVFSEQTLKQIASTEGAKRIFESFVVGGVLGTGITGVMAKAAGLPEQINEGTQDGDSSIQQPQTSSQSSSDIQAASRSDIQSPQFDGQRQVSAGTALDGGQSVDQQAINQVELDTPGDFSNKLPVPTKLNNKAIRSENAERSLAIAVRSIEAVASAKAVKQTDTTLDSEVDSAAVNAPTFKKFSKEAGSAAVSSSGIIPGDKLQFKNETFVQRLKRKIVDNNERLGVVQQQLREQGGTVRDESDVFVAKRLMTKRTNARIAEFNKKVVDPFLQTVAKSGFSLRQIDSYLHAKHAAERNAKMGKDGASRLTDKQADEILGAFSVSQTQRLESIRKALSSILDANLQYQADAGILTQDEINTLKNQYQFYVPLHREFLDSAGVIRGSGKGASVEGKGIFRARGSDRAVLPITGEIFNKINQSIERAESNLVGQTFAQLVRDNPAPQLWTISGRKAIGTKFGEDGELLFQDLKNNQFGFRENGKQKVITIHDPLTVRALKNEGMTKSWAQARAPLALMSQLITAYDPTFIGRNFSRDVFEALINSREIRDLNLTDAQKKGFTRDIAKNTPSIAKGIYKDIRGGGTSRWTETITRFALDGGKSGNFWLDKHKTLNQRLKGFQKQYKNNGFKRLINPVKTGLEFIKTLNEVAENTTRVSVYHALVSRGVPSSKAAFIAGEITIDFSRQGELSPRLKSLYLFINPAIQGGTRVARAIKNKNVQAAAGGLVVAGFLRTVLSQYLDDETDDAIYDYSKNTSLTFPIPGTGHRVTLGYLPYGYNSFYAVGSNLAYWSLNKKTKFEVTRDTFNAALDSFNPLGGSRLSWTMPIPTILKIPVEIAVNEGWHGGPIYPDQNTWEVRLPDKDRYFKSIRPTFKIISEWLASTTKTDRFPKGLIDVSPESLDYATAQYGGGVGQGISNALATSESVIADHKLPKASHIPFLRELVRDVDIERYHKNILFEMHDQSKIIKYSPLEVERFEKSINFLKRKRSLSSKTVLGIKREFHKNQRDL